MKKSNFKGKKKIVVELPFGLGDQIMCFPLFVSIKKAIPDSIITVLSPNKNSTIILSKNKFIDSIFEYGLNKFNYWEVFKFFIMRFFKLWFFFKKESFDIFIIIHPNLFRKLLLKFLPYKYSLVNIENIHKTKEVVNILNKLGIKSIYDYSMEIQHSKEVLFKYRVRSKDYVLLDIYAQHLNKDPRQWPYFNELIAELQKKKKNVIIAGLNPGHNYRKDIIDVINKTSLEELLVIIKNAKLVIALDSGIFHFAYSLGRPVIGIFGPVNPKDRIPFNKKLKVKTFYNNKECSPCIINKVDIKCKNRSNPYGCVKDIHLDEVLKVIESMQ